MITTPDFVFIHLQKCGGSFLRKYLIKYISGAQYSGETHDKACDIPQQHRGKQILGTIRNPWEWYISWYAGTQRSKKGHFWVLHKNGKQTTFVEFMENILRLNKRIHNIDFALINRLRIGVYTYRYIQSYCHNPNKVLEQLQSQSLTDGMVFKIHLCRTENLRSDLEKFLTATPNGITASQTKNLMDMAKINVSKHGKCQDHYNAQLRTMVGERDKYIVDRFGYVFETGN